MRCCIGAQHIFKRNRFWAKYFNVRFPHSTKYSSQIGINIWRWDGHMYMYQCSKYLCMYHSRLIIGEKCYKLCVHHYLAIRCIPQKISFVGSFGTTQHPIWKKKSFYKVKPSLIFLEFNLLYLHWTWVWRWWWVKFRFRIPYGDVKNPVLCLDSYYYIV